MCTNIDNNTNLNTYTIYYINNNTILIRGRCLPRAARRHVSYVYYSYYYYDYDYDCYYYYHRYSLINIIIIFIIIL